MRRRRRRLKEDLDTWWSPMIIQNSSLTWVPTPVFRVPAPVSPMGLTTMASSPMMLGKVQLNYVQNFLFSKLNGNSFVTILDCPDWKKKVQRWISHPPRTPQPCWVDLVFYYDSTSSSLLQWVVVDLGDLAQIQLISPRYMLSSAPCFIASWFLAITLTGGWSKCAQLNKQLYALLTEPPSVISSSCLHMYM